MISSKKNKLDLFYKMTKKSCLMLELGAFWTFFNLIPSVSTKIYNWNGNYFIFKIILQSSLVKEKIISFTLFMSSGRLSIKTVFY